MGSRKTLEMQLEQFYGKTWRDWYKPFPDKKKASLVVKIDSGNSCYNYQADIITIFISKDDLTNQNSEDKNIDKWPACRIDLIEEMLHEYQYKIIKEPTPEGQQLYKEFGRILSGKGHDEKFVTAVSIHASYFGITPQQLLEKLGYKLQSDESSKIISRIISDTRNLDIKKIESKKPITKKKKS